MPDSIWFVKIAVAIRHNTFSSANNSAHNRNNKFSIVTNHLLTSWSGTSWNNLWSIHRKCFAGKSGSVTKPLVTIPIRHKIRLRAPLMPGKWRVSEEAEVWRGWGRPRGKSQEGGWTSSSTTWLHSNASHAAFPWMGDLWIKITELGSIIIHHFSKTNLKAC